MPLVDFGTMKTRLGQDETRQRGSDERKGVLIGRRLIPEEHLLRLVPFLTASLCG